MNSIHNPLLIVLALLGSWASAQESHSLDIYGGVKSLKATATGHFRLEDMHSRTFLVTPEGHAYFALGLNHINVSHQEQYLHLDEFKGNNSRAEKIRADLSMWKMNNCGYGCPEELQNGMPFFSAISFLSNGHYKAKGEFRFDDVFDQAFLLQSKNRIKSICSKHAENPFLIGYYFTDTPRWDVLISRKRHGEDWVSFLRSLGSESAGKKRYVQFIRERYSHIGAFNTAYGLHFETFDQLLGARFDHIDIQQRHIILDDQAFLGVIAEHLYQFISSEIKKHDPNHLLFGDKYIAGDHPVEVLRAAAKYTDVISIQPGPTSGPGPGPGVQEQFFDEILFEDLYNKYGKPIHICDHQTSFYTHKYPITLWHQFPTQQASGISYERYMRSCTSKPYIIGYQRCQYIDYYDRSRGLLKQGLLNQDGLPYGEISRWTTRVNQEILQDIYDLK